MGARDCQLTGRDVRRGSNLTQPPRDAVGWKAVWVGKGTFLHVTQHAFSRCQPRAYDLLLHLYDVLSYQKIAVERVSF